MTSRRIKRKRALKPALFQKPRGFRLEHAHEDRKRLQKRRACRLPVSEDDPK